MPSLSPSIPGHWTIQGGTAVFVPVVGYPEDTKVTVTIPAGLTGVMSASGAIAHAGGTLAGGASQSFTTGSYPTVRLQQPLAPLGYLPLTWTSTSNTVISPTDPPGQLPAAYAPPPRRFRCQTRHPRPP